MATSEQLQVEAPIFFERLKFLPSPDSLGDCLWSALWAIQYLRVRYPRHWWGAKRSPLGGHRLDLPLEQLSAWGFEWNESEKRLLKEHATVGDLWSERAFRSTPTAVHRAFLKWSTADYPLVKMHSIPSVREVLAQQIQGKRCVTLMKEEHQLKGVVLGERDALSFAFHDLIHADHFFHDNEMKQGQMGFYRQMDALLKTGALDGFMSCQDFPDRLDYLVADMNAHPVHLWMSLKGICRRASPALAQDFFEEKLQGLFVLDKNHHEALKSLNDPLLQTTAHDMVITDWCQSYA